VSSADLHLVETTFKGGFDPHSLPPFFNTLQTRKSLASQFGFGRAICTTTQEHIGAVLPDKIVYDAQTTGGSGGPLFNNGGRVIGINFAVLRDFGGSNFAIPVSYGQSLLKP
jgi:hypothetical protein